MNVSQRFVFSQDITLIITLLIKNFYLELLNKKSTTVWADGSENIRTSQSCGRELAFLEHHEYL